MVAVDAALLLTLTDKVPLLAAPSMPHAQTPAIGGRVSGWAEDLGLVIGDPDTSPLGRARFERLAGRILPGADAERVTLLARWLLWFFALDDALDDTPLGGSATSVQGFHEQLARAVRRGSPRPEAGPLEIALVELWWATAPRMSPWWRHRFLAHLDQHRAGCAEEAVDRRTGHTPPIDGYPALRRRAAGPFLYDLLEPALGVELPARLPAGRAWRALLAAISDVITWCNDVVSCPKETLRRDAHNHVTVLSAAHGLGSAEAARRVVRLIARRAGEARLAAHALDPARGVDPDLPAGSTGKLDPGDGATTPGGQFASIVLVLRCLLGAPRAHLDWLLETGRYTCRRPEVPAPRAGAPFAAVRG